jgi:hypothetical protein
VAPSDRVVVAPSPHHSTHGDPTRLNKRNTRALSDGLGAWDWAALLLLFLVGAQSVFILWPYYNYSFRFDPQDLLDRYIDREPPASLSEMHRTLGLRIKQDMANNWRIIQPMRFALQLALILFLLEILVWLLSIAGM